MTPNTTMLVTISEEIRSCTPLKSPNKAPNRDGGHRRRTSTSWSNKKKSPAQVEQTPQTGADWTSSRTGEAEQATHEGSCHQSVQRRSTKHIDVADKTSADRSKTFQATIGPKAEVIGDTSTPRANIEVFTRRSDRLKSCPLEKKRS